MKGLAKAAVVFLGVAALAAEGRAESYLGVRELGDPVRGAGARSVAMGSTGLSRAKDAAVFRLNPALLADLPQAEASITAGPSFLTEKFVDASTESRFRDNAGLQLNELSLLLPLKPGRFWLGLSIAPEADFGYEAGYRLFTSSASPYGDARLEASGTLWSLGPSLAFAFSEGFSAGLSYAFWTGSEDIDIRRTSFSSGTIVGFREQADYRGGAPQAGFRWRASENLSFGGSFRPSGRLTREYDLANATAPARNRSGKSRWDLPAQWALGFSYRAEGEHDAEFCAEVRQAFWSRAKLDGRRLKAVAATKPVFEEAAAASASLFNAAASPRSFGDTLEVNVGAEHAITPQWHLRYGFRHQPHFADRAVEATFFSIGVGHDSEGRWGWSAAAEMGKRDYEGENLFFDSTRRVDETIRRILVTGRLRW